MIAYYFDSLCATLRPPAGALYTHAVSVVLCAVLVAHELYTRCVVRAANWIASAGAASLAPALGQLIGLTQLDLEGERLLHGAAIGMHAVRCSRCRLVTSCYMLAHHVMCTYCMMGAGNRIGAAGGASLAPVLRQLSGLTALSLHGE